MIYDVAIVGCGRRKLDHAAPAEQLYCGSLFRASARWARTHAHRWCILSARHRVLAPEDIVEPYDYSMHDLQRAKGPRFAPTPHELWITRCRADLMVAWGGARPWVQASDRVVLLAGADYADPLVEWLEAWDVHIEQPLRGLGIGQRMRWLTRCEEEGLQLSPEEA